MLSFKVTRLAASTFFVLSFLLFPSPRLPVHKSPWHGGTWRSRETELVYKKDGFIFFPPVSPCYLIRVSWQCCIWHASLRSQRYLKGCPHHSPHRVWLSDSSSAGQQHFSVVTYESDIVSLSSRRTAAEAAGRLTAPLARKTAGKTWFIFRFCCLQDSLRLLSHVGRSGKLKLVASRNTSHQWHKYSFELSENQTLPGAMVKL